MSEASRSAESSPEASEASRVDRGSGAAAPPAPFARDVLPVIRGGPSLFAQGTRRLCAWIPPGEQPHEIPEGTRKDSKFCGKTCRQQSWRFGVGRAPLEATDRPLRLAFVDPPYPGKAFYYKEKTEVDHAALIARVDRAFPDGWALSTRSGALRELLPLCPPEPATRVAAWFRSVRRVKSRKALGGWEPLIVVRGRPLPVGEGAQEVVDMLLDLEDATRRSSTPGPDVRDALDRPATRSAPPAPEDAYLDRGRFRAFPGALVGMKPPGFSEWMFGQLGARAGDTLHDIFPGSGAVTFAWERFAGGPAVAGWGDASRSDASPRPRGGDFQGGAFE